MQTSQSCLSWEGHNYLIMKNNTNTKIKQTFFKSNFKTNILVCQIKYICLAAVSIVQIQILERTFKRHLSFNDSHQGKKKKIVVKKEKEIIVSIQMQANVIYRKNTSRCCSWGEGQKSCFNVVWFWPLHTLTLLSSSRWSGGSSYKCFYRHEQTDLWSLTVEAHTDDTHS